VTDFRDQFIGAYFAECEEHLTTIRRALLALEGSVGESRPDLAITEELFRSYHSLKGLAGMVEDRTGEILSHEMESYLRAIREGDVALTTGGIEALIAGTSALEQAILARRDSSDVPDTSPALLNLRVLVAGGTAAAEPRERRQAPRAAADWECVFAPSPALIARGVNVDAVRARLRASGEIISATPVVTEDGVAFKFLFAGVLDEATAGAWREDGIVCSPVLDHTAVHLAEATDASPAAAGTTHSNYVRVDLARLDDLMRMIGDLVMLRARLTETLGQVERHVPSSHWRSIQETTTAVDRQVRTLREGVMRVRLVPVGEIFRRMPFVVRDLARESGQRITVELTGQETEIDKFLVERMMDPVLQLVRNAASHGIEPAAERRAAGKPAAGSILLRGSAAGDIVTIEVADDGRGIDRAGVLRRAQQMGLAGTAHVDDAALLDIICSPGFSTRKESDHVSGRGFGMAVVRNRVQELGGTVRMMTTPGAGTRFIIELPLTLAIVEALLARVGNQTFAVPQTAVREVIEVDTAAIRRLEGHEVTEYRGGALMVIRLSEVLGIAAAPQARLHAFVVGDGAEAIGLIVDRIVGQREIVVRATTDPLIRIDGIAGATDLGDGRAVLILDAPAVTRRIPRLRATA
jgi:two-component system chemotaxis sensor kinase CheA